MVFLFHSWYVMLGFVRNMKIFCSEDLHVFWFQIYWGKDILHGNFRLLLGKSMVVIQTLFTNLCVICWRVCSPTVTYNWFPVTVNHDGSHMWVRECLFFPEYIISLSLGSLWFHPFICFVSDLFYNCTPSSSNFEQV